MRYIVSYFLRRVADYIGIKKNIKDFYDRNPLEKFIERVVNHTKSLQARNDRVGIKDMTRALKDVTGGKLELIVTAQNSDPKIKIKDPEAMADIKDPKVRELIASQNFKIYVDMDGVLTDFPAAVAELDPEYSKIFTDEKTAELTNRMNQDIIKAGPEFWSQMAWKKDGKELLDALRKYGPVILSSPGADGRFREQAEEGKGTWVQNNCPDIPYFLEPDKYIYADRDAVLIDDYLKNTGAWKAHGGEAILHKDTATTLKELEELIRSRKIMS